MFRIFYHPHHHRHHRMGLGRALLMGLFFGPLLFRRMMRWQRHGGYGWYGGPRGGWYGGWDGPRRGWRGEDRPGPRGPRGPRGADYV